MMEVCRRIRWVRSGKRTQNELTLWPVIEGKRAKMAGETRPFDRLRVTGPRLASAATTERKYEYNNWTDLRLRRRQVLGAFAAEVRRAACRQTPLRRTRLIEAQLQLVQCFTDVKTSGIVSG